MSSLKRDTPAGRAALARRRQRAAAVVENPTRFVGTPTNDGTCMGVTGSDSTSPTQEQHQQQQQQQSRFSFYQVDNEQQEECRLGQPQRQHPAQQQYQQKQHLQQTNRTVTASFPQEPSQQQHHYQLQQRRFTSSPPVRTPKKSTTSTANDFDAMTGSTTPYSVAALPQPDELLERSSKVGLQAAFVLASARKCKQSGNNSHQKQQQAKQPQQSNTTSIHDQPAATTTANSTSYNTSFTAFQRVPQTTSPNRPNIASPRRTASPYGIVTSSPSSSARVHSQQQNPTMTAATVEDEPTQGGAPAEPYQDAANRPTDELTVEELEPVLTQKEKDNEGMDATCLVSGSWIMLRSMSTGSTVVATEQIQLQPSNAVATNLYGALDMSAAVEQPDLSIIHEQLQPQRPPETSQYLAQPVGFGLGRQPEVLQLIKVVDYGTDPVDHQEQDRVLRWGDNVSLLFATSTTNTNNTNNPRSGCKALGVSKMPDNFKTTSDDGNRHSSNTNTAGNPAAGADYQIGFFQSSLGLAETWTMLRAGTDRQVRIGMAAVRAAKGVADQRRQRGLTAAVRSGDSIILRNCQTGGILSIAGGAGEAPFLPQLKLTTDSYNSDGLTAQATTDPSGLLEQLQRHEKYWPKDADTFSLLHASVPPCPRWILSRSPNNLDHRTFQRQTFLAHANRHDRNNIVTNALFGQRRPAFPLERHQGESGASLDFNAQEALLLDEVIGSFLGLEGQYIHAKKPQNETNEPEQGQSLTLATQMNVRFELADGMNTRFDAGLRNQVERILPLSNAYLRVSVFVASHFPGYEFGSVMQALCEALDALLQEYASFVTELELQRRESQCHGNTSFTMRGLHVKVLSSLHSMSILDRATVAVRDKTGGALINALAKLKAWSCEGDVVANNVLASLLEKTSIPYMTMLTTWLQHGVLRDPYEEFMIEIGEVKRPGRHSARAAFSNESYSIREEHVISGFMSTEMMLQKIVATGKYWRAVRACEVVESTSSNQESVPSLSVLQYGFDFARTSSYIQSMYEKASQALVRLLMEDFDLMDSLRTMKRYFLLDQGDFLVHFLDAAEDELLKELGDISSGRIQHWLRMAVQLTEVHFREDELVDIDGLGASLNSSKRTLSAVALRCRFQPESLIKHVGSLRLALDETYGNDADTTYDDDLVDTPSRQAYGLLSKGLTGVETFVLDFPVLPFPISLVLSESAIENYQLLFRLLFFAKYVERRLVGIWQDHQAMKELSSLRGLFGPTFLLRQRMLHFAQNLIYYIMFEVIEPNWLEMEDAIVNPANEHRRTVDDIVDVHDEFLRRTLQACLLTNRDLVRTMSKLMTTCLMFADQMKLFMEATRLHDDSTTLAAERRSAIQRTLNDRGGAKATTDKNALREAMNAFKEERQNRVKKQKRRVGRELSSDSYRRMVSRFDEVFSVYLRELIIQLGGDAESLYHTHQANLCIRLDYNGFLTSSIVIDENRH